MRKMHSHPQWRDKLQGVQESKITKNSTVCIPDISAFVPHTQALCHCQDCRKISGSTYSTNLFVPTSALQLVSGTPKQYSKRTDAGNSITSYFCGDCGVTLWRQSSGYPVCLFVCLFGVFLRGCVLLAEALDILLLLTDLILRIGCQDC